MQLFNKLQAEFAADVFTPDAYDGRKLEEFSARPYMMAVKTRLLRTNCRWAKTILDRFSLSFHTS